MHQIDKKIPCAKTQTCLDIMPEPIGNVTVAYRITTIQGFPLEFYFRGHKSPLTLIQGDISGDFRGQSYDT